ncbi:MAG TPA: heme-binding protein [Solirubrobacteraceae bacterium]|nr:heme-binding protein [Solirubrobacteraceae bacterium]
MGVIAQTDPNFVFEGLPPIAEVTPDVATAQPVDPLGPLAQLPGTWTGQGFNTIWRPHHPDSPQDRFLELNLTTETLVFTKINGPIPNRGLLMPDINMFGITYMQQISETSSGAGLHIEPGIWVNVPSTSNPTEPSTVVRMASIPHGTVILAQGTTQFLEGGPPNIPDNNIIPFGIGSPPPANSDFANGEQAFPELNLSISTPFRHASSGVTQAMVKNPNSVLQAAIQGKPMKNRTFIKISTTHNPIKGGGTANTAFLADGSNPPGGNANAVEVDATFWIQTLPGAGGQPDTLQLQYTQLVQLDFNGLRWPHVTVATLHKQ